MRKAYFFVATHKEALIPKDEMMMSIHVGRVLSTSLAGMVREAYVIANRKEKLLIPPSHGLQNDGLD